MNRGFTLIELILVIIIGGIVGGFTFAFVSESVKAYRVMQTQGALYQEATYALERITRDLRDASFNLSAGTEISFVKPTRSAAQAPKVMDRNSFVRYYRFGSSLYRCSDSSMGLGCLSDTDALQISKLIASNIDDFRVDLPDPSAATPCSFNPSDSSTYPTCQDDTFTITIRLASQGQNVTLSTTVTPKNYCANGTSGTSCIMKDYGNRSFNEDYQDVVN